MWLCILLYHTPTEKTSLLLQYFNTVKATWSKFPSCSCGQLVTHNRIIHSVLNWQLDDRCLLSTRCFETGQWSLGPKCCNFSKQFVIFETSPERMHMFLVTYSSVDAYFFVVALVSLWKLSPSMELLRIFLYLLRFVGSELTNLPPSGSAAHQVPLTAGSMRALLSSRCSTLPWKAHMLFPMQCQKPLGECCVMALERKL